MFERRRTKHSSKLVRGSLLVVFLGIMILILVFFKMYGRIFNENVSLESEYIIFYINSGSEYGNVAEALVEKEIVDDRKSFDWVATKKGYTEYVKAGRYRIRNGMSNNDLVNLLRSGKQDPVMVVFNNTRTLAAIAGKVSDYLESDSATLVRYLLNPETAESFGFEAHVFSSMFIPNTYEFYWTVSPEQFAERMKTEYEGFWEGERDRKAKRLDMSREEVITLASIVDEETLYDEENASIAGVYLNRLDQGIPLQADPTLRFALGDFTRQRMVNDDKKIDSPYNTYKYRGLPPGPISIPSISAIDGVLNPEKHNYIFFCAKADFSGYHAFARTLTQHNRNAREYQKAMDRKRIYR